MSRKKLEDDLATLLYWWSGLNRAIWKNTELIRDFSPQHKQNVQDASSKLYELKDILESSFISPIGKSVIEEIKCGVGRRRRK